MALNPAQNARDQPSTSAPQSIEDEVLANVRNQQSGENQTLADYNLPEEFLRTVADRVIRSSFEQRYRLMVRDAAMSGAMPLQRHDAGSQPQSQSETQDSNPTRAAGPPARGGHMNRALGLLIVMPALLVVLVVMLRRRGKST